MWWTGACSHLQVEGILRANLKDHLHHLHSSVTGEATSAASHPGAAAHQAPSDGRRLASSTDLRLQVLCKVLSSVYAARFFSSEDQAAVNALIARHMQVPDVELVTGWGASLVTQVPCWLKVGAVYLSKGESRHVLPNTACSMCRRTSLRRPNDNSSLQCSTIRL
jgi:hypothetical protein